MEDFENVIKDNEVFLTHGFDRSKSLEIIDKIENKLKSGEKKIILYINSTGGLISEFFNLQVHMENFKNKGGIIETHGFSQVHSIALFLLSSGSKGHRFIKNNTKALVHEPLLGGIPDEEMTVKQVKFKESLKDSLSQLLYERGNKKMTVEDIKNSMKESSYLNADEIIENGYADHVEEFQNNLEDNLEDIQNNENVHNNKLNNKMKEVEELQKKLEEISAKVEKLEKFENSIDVIEGGLVETNEQLKSVKDQLFESKKKEKTDFLNAAVESGKITKEEVAEWSNNLDALGIERTSALLSKINKSSERGVTTPAVTENVSTNPIDEKLSYFENSAPSEMTKREFNKFISNEFGENGNKPTKEQEERISNLDIKF